MRTTDLRVDRMPQEECEFCGPAVASMILTRLEGENLPNQSKMHELIGIEINGLFTPPSGLLNALNKFNPRPGTIFELRAETDPIKGCKILVNDILGRQAPSAALIRQCGHWVVISGVRFEGSLEERRIELSEFLIDDPDDSCLRCSDDTPLGVVEDLIIGCIPGLPSDPVLETATATDWLEGHWREGCDRVVAGTARFVTIGLSGEEADFDLSFRQEPAAMVAVEVAEAREFAARGIEFFKLHEWERFKPCVEGDWGEVVEVEAEAYGDYYLVERRSKRGTMAIFRVDKKTGRLLGVRGFPEPKTSAFPAPELVASILKKSGARQIGNHKVNLALGFRPDKPLVWKRSKSRSPYRPMFPIDMEEGRLLLGSNGLITK
jgi:hypothetical protein